jgi:predicted signal transduction protein with EAL and GGDEF domain
VITELDALVPLDRRNLIQTTNLCITLLVAFLGAIKLAILGVESFPFPAFFVVTAGIANAIYIKRHGSVDIAAWILVIIALLGLTFASMYSGGFEASIVLLTPIIPIMTVLLINTRAAWLTLGIVCLILTGVFVLGVYGYLPKSQPAPEVVQFGRYIVLTSLCLISTWVVLRFATQSRTLLVQLEQQSIIDYLTGILNRRGIETRLLQEVGRAKRNDTWLSFVIADVDFFKLYNDSNGHQSGDDCLKDIAILINNCCERPTDVVGRYGWEEFVLILPYTDNDGAGRIA